MKWGSIEFLHHTSWLKSVAETTMLHEQNVVQKKINDRIKQIYGRSDGRLNMHTPTDLLICLVCIMIVSTIGPNLLIVK